jgi:hypothetical protein
MSKSNTAARARGTWTRMVCVAACVLGTTALGTLASNGASTGPKHHANAHAGTTKHGAKSATATKKHHAGARASKHARKSKGGAPATTSTKPGHAGTGTPQG